MAITLFGSISKILMPDGTWFQYLSGGAGQFQYYGGLITFQGSGSTDGSNSGTYVSFNFSFPNTCLGVIVCEGNAAGWGGTGMTVFGVTSLTTSGFYIRGIFKKDGVFNGPNQPGLALGYKYMAFGY